jgi:hypothetical protein
VENSRLCSLTIILEDSAAGRLWSCGTMSLARNSRESFLQWVVYMCAYINIGGHR